MLSRNQALRIATAVLISAFAICLPAQNSKHRGRKYKAPPPVSRIEVSILRDADSKPIENASVIFHLVGDQGNMELKTNEDGKTVLDVIPIGSAIRLQVIAHGFQTYGEDFDVDKAQMSFEVRMKRPGQQYSIYEKHGKSASANKSGEKKPDDADGSAAPKEQAKPSDNESQESSKPDSADPKPE